MPSLGGAIQMAGSRCGGVVLLSKGMPGKDGPHCIQRCRVVPAGSDLRDGWSSVARPRGLGCAGCDSAGGQLWRNVFVGLGKAEGLSTADERVSGAERTLPHARSSQIKLSESRIMR